MSQTPRSVLQDGSAEVPTSAWGITPPRSRPRESTQQRSNGAGQRPAPIQSNCHGDPRSRRPQKGRVGKFLDPRRGQQREGTSQGCRNTSTTIPRDFKRRENRSPRGPPSRKCTRRATLELNPRWVQRAVSAVSLRTASRPVELSLQSTLQLSLTVLVRYRTRARI